MASTFDTDWASARSVFDDEFAEPVEFRPQVDSEIIVVGADPDRPVRALIGIFSERVVIAKPVGAGADTHDTVDVTTSRTAIDLAASLFASVSDYPRQGDILVLTTRVGLPQYQIESTEPDHVSRIVCIVTPLGSAT